MSLSRSENMARIKSVNSKPEIILRRALWSRGLRYRIHYAVEKIKPDIVFTRARLAVFIDGCQWHGCPVHYVRPRTRQDFWQKKLRDAVVRDSVQTVKLRQAGWQVVRCWEHEVWEDTDRVVERIQASLRGKSSTVDVQWRVIQVEEIDPLADIERQTLCHLDYLETLRFETKPRRTTKWNRNAKHSSKKAIA
ncbi:MAG: very short patch repair endonuclease [Caldilineaceae bacterium]